ncbi:hypothetical protein ACFL6U_22220, partial [Planctomycetota bacterium]
VILLENIKNVWSSPIYEAVVKLLVLSFGDYNFYDVIQSSYVNQLIELCRENEPDVLMDLVGFIKDNNALTATLDGLDELLAKFIKTENVDVFVHSISVTDEGKKLALETLMLFRFTENDETKSIFEEGRKHFELEYREYEEKIKSVEEERTQLVETHRVGNENVFNTFLYKLEPEPDKYVSDLFDYYLRHKDAIDASITSCQREQLQLLVLNVLRRVDSLQCNLDYLRNEADGSTYKTEESIRIFEVCLRVVQHMELPITEAGIRQNIVNYIPYGYIDTLDLIFEILGDVSSRELEPVMEVYRGGRDDDLFVHSPNSFSEACERLKSKAAVPILKEFVSNEVLRIDERERALRSIVAISDQREYLLEQFDKYSVREDKGAQKLSEIVNYILVSRWRDGRMVKWRLGELKKRAFKFTPIDGGHIVGDLEHELKSQEFAGPLKELKEPRFIEEILDVLNCSFLLVEEDKEYWSYATYLQDVVYTFFENLKVTRDYHHLLRLEGFVEKYHSMKECYWFKMRLRNLRKTYLEYISNPNDFSRCIQEYNRVKKCQYLDIASSTDLYKLIREVIEKELVRFIEDEGFYRVVNDVRGKQEDIIQKTIKTEIENVLMRRGIRDAEIRREEQLLDNKRTDLQISYGFVGPIVLEIKLTKNVEIYSPSKRKAYKKKMLQYVNGMKADYGIFLVLQVDDEHPIDKYMDSIHDLYMDCGNIAVIGMDCLATS